MPVIQYFGTGISDGVPFRFFTDYFGEDFDAYICRSFCDQFDDYEDELQFQESLNRTMAIDRKLEGRAKHIRLKDISSDGRIYLSKQ